MIQSGMQLFEAVAKQNWRVLPIQFGLPAPSQTLADLIREAGFEAILYQSSKGPGKCLALFPDKLSDRSFIELIDPPPSKVGSRSQESLGSKRLVKRPLRQTKCDLSPRQICMSCFYFYSKLPLRMPSALTSRLAQRCGLHHLEIKR